MIDKVRGGLRHVPAIAGRANPAPLARERDDKPLAAARAEGTAKPEAEDAALEIPAEFLLDVTRHGTLRLVTQLEPAPRQQAPGAQRSRPLAIPVLTPEKPESFCPRPLSTPKAKLMARVGEEVAL